MFQTGGRDGEHQVLLLSLKGPTRPQRQSLLSIQEAHPTRFDLPQEALVPLRDQTHGDYTVRTDDTTSTSRYETRDVVEKMLDDLFRNDRGVYGFDKARRLVRCGHGTCCG